MKAGKTLLLVAFAAGLLTASAQAALYLDVTSTSGVYIPVTDPATFVLGNVTSGGTDALKLNVRIAASADPTQDALIKYTIRTVSTNVGGGLIKGTTTAIFHPDAKLPIPTGEYDPDTGDPLYTPGFGAENSPTGKGYVGMSQDLDSDGDLDRGSTDIADPANWMRGSIAPGVWAYQTSADGFKMYRLRFTGTAWASANPHGVTVIQAINAEKYGWTAWAEDGVPQGSIDPLTGKTVTLYRPDDAMLDGSPNAAVLDLRLGGSGTLDASGSIGSLDQWQWDVNGDGTYEVKTATGHAMTFTVYASGLVEYNDGVGDSGSFMPTPAQVAAEKLTVGLRTKWGNDGSPLTSDTASATLLLPEPATMALLGLGGLALAIRRRRAA